jgi:hypothetical protein
MSQAVGIVPETGRTVASGSEVGFPNHGPSRGQPASLICVDQWPNLWWGQVRAGFPTLEASAYVCQLCPALSADLYLRLAVAQQWSASSLLFQALLCFGSRGVDLC